MMKKKWILPAAAAIAVAGALLVVALVPGKKTGAVAVLAGLAMLVMALNMLGVFRLLRRIRLRLPSGLHAALWGRA